MDHPHCLLDGGDSIVIVCPGRSFLCSKAALSRCSTYFQAMFSSGMREASCSEIHLFMYDSSIMEVVIQYIQNGVTTNLSSHNIHQVLEASVYFQIENLQTICEDRILLSVDTHNALKLWRQYPACGKIKTKTETFVLRNFIAIAKTDELVNLDGRELLYFLSHDNLFVEDRQAEEELCKQVTLWFENGKIGNTENYVQTIFDLIKLSLLDRKYLLQLKKSFYFAENKYFKQLLREALHYHDNPGFQLICDSNHAQPRICYSSQKVLIVFGLFYKFYSSGNYRLICYCIRDKRWKELCSPPQGLSPFHASCTYGESILLVSGGKHTRAVFRYNGLSNMWSQCSAMKENRMQHVMLAVREHVYCLGGKILLPTSRGFEETILSSVVKYDPKTNSSWKRCGDLSVGVLNASSAAANDKIYVVGGNVLDLEDPVTTIQCFDVETYTCSVYCHTPFKFDRICVTYSVNSIFILADEKLYNFHITDDVSKDRFLEVGHEDGLYFNSALSAVYCDQCLYVIGDIAEPVKTADKIYQLKLMPKYRYEKFTDLPHIPKSVTCRTLIVDFSKIN